MKTGHKLSAIFLVVILTIMGGCDQPTHLQQTEEREALSQTTSAQAIPGQYIVVFKDAVTKEMDRAKRAQAAGRAIQNVTSSYGIESSAVVNRYRYSVSGFTARLSDAQLKQLREDSRVDYIEQDRIVTFAPPCGTPNGGPCEGDGGGSGGQTTPWGVSRVGGPVSSSGTAWVIDTGIDLDHPDLNVDQARSETFITRGKDSKSADDGNGHGTHVAGTIAALDNDIDVVGVAAGATVVAVKVLDSRGSGSYSGVIAGVDYVAANASNGDVANMSLGGPTSQALDDAVRNAADAGVKFALAAGNDGDDANNYSPARVEYNNVWTVSAIDDSDTFASFSNYSGPTDPPIEFAAPGVSVQSLYKNGGTATLDGTSMASPHVAGLLLLGNVTADGYASGDPDGDPDPVAHN